MTHPTQKARKERVGLITALMACCLFVLHQPSYFFLVRKRSYTPIVIRSPSERAIPCIFLWMRTCSVILPASVRSTLRLASASSPKKYAFVPVKKIVFVPRKRSETTHQETSGVHVHRQEVTFPTGVRHDIFVAFMACFRYSRRSLSNPQGQWKQKKMTARDG